MGGWVGRTVRQGRVDVDRCCGQYRKDERECILLAVGGWVGGLGRGERGGLNEVLDLYGWWMGRWVGGEVSTCSGLW